MQHEVSSKVTPATDTVPKAYTGPDFYNVPDPLPDAAHGTLIRFERSRNRAIPGTTAYRIMYLSESLTGNRVAVTGMATVPTATPGGDGRSVVSLGHGTSGIADRCAPSKYPAVPELSAAQAGLGQEALIAQTDYEGVGTPGRHPYLVGQSEGRSMLDAAIAAGQLPNARPGTDLAVAGYSQGGQAALWAAQLAASWTPEFHLVGTFAGAPASETDLTLAAAPSLPSAAYTYLLVAGYAAAYPEADPNLILTEQGVRSLDTVDSNCVTGLVKTLATRPVSDLIRPDGPQAEPWRQLAEDNIAGTKKTGIAPTLLIHSQADETVPAGLSERLLQRMCAHGQIVERRVLPRGTHGEAAAPAYEQAFTWLTARLDPAGPAATSTCPE